MEEKTARSQKWPPTEWPSPSEPEWTMIATIPCCAPQSRAVAPSQISSTACSSTKWLPPPTEPICGSRPSVLPDERMKSAKAKVPSVGEVRL